jgi:hypothetical protein
MVFKHLLDGDVLVLVEILLIGLVLFDLRRGAQWQEKGYDDEKLSHDL